jgi:Tol biopolymer transport system component
MRAVVPALAALVATACAARGVPDAELPETPIAIVYRTPEDSRRRADELADQASGGPTQRIDPLTLEPEAVARVKDIAGYLRLVMTGSAGDPEERRFPGRLALLHPRSRRIEVLTSAWPGAVPQAWSPDRRRLLFTQLVDEYAQVFELDAVAGDVRPITRGPAVHPAGCHGPDHSIVIMSARVVDGGVESRIELREPGRPEARALTPGPLDYAPTCAPDGSAVAYVSRTPRGAESVMIRALAEEAEPRWLGPGRDPRYCADGEWIVYSAPSRRGLRIWRVRPDGSGRAPVGQGALDETTPACSPAGDLVVYGVTEEYRDHLYVRRFDGSGDRILFADGGASHPVW